VSPSLNEGRGWTYSTSSGEVHFNFYEERDSFSFQRERKPLNTSRLDHTKGGGGGWFFLVGGRTEITLPRGGRPYAQRLGTYDLTLRSRRRTVPKGCNGEGEAGPRNLLQNLSLNHGEKGGKAHQHGRRVAEKAAEIRLTEKGKN